MFSNHLKKMYLYNWFVWIRQQTRTKHCFSFICFKFLLIYNTPLDAIYLLKKLSFVTSNCSHSGFGWLCSHGDLSLIFPVSSWLMSQCPFFLGATYFSSYHVKKNVASARHSFSNALTAHGVQASPLSSIYCNRSTSRHTAFPLTGRTAFPLTVRALV